MMEIGSQIGPYRVLSKLGEGGMGEVYRAHDPKLGRDVAIKVLPDAVAQDPDRRSRFEREARMLAALHHPHIAQIFGLEGQDGQDGRDGKVPSPLAIVMELVEGQTLQERIARGPVPVGEALAIARQMAEALDAAHERGIVHRDLKPANVKVTKDGTVKVLDFGLATAIARDPEDASALATQRVTEPGTIVGTAAYMSPEQARGQAIDKRTDIWAFGCVLYEMLTGKAAFAGETTSDVMANVLQTEPVWDALPASTPAPVKRLITRCLEKDQRRRLRDIGDVRADLEAQEGPETSSRRTGPPAQSAGLWIAAIAVAAAATGLAVWRLKPAPQPVAPAGPPPVSRFFVAPPEGVPPLVESRLDLSPDGQRLVFVSGNNGVPSLYVRHLGQFTSTLIPGTAGADHPAVSPDGTEVAFVADRKIKKIALSGGGEPVVVCESSVGLGLSWGTDGRIYFNPGPSYGISRVPASGGVLAAVTTLRDGEVEHRFPELMPDGATLLYTALAGGTGNDQIFAESLRTGQRVLVGPGRSPHYVSSGHLVYERDGVIYAAAFDAAQLKLTAAPAIVQQGAYLTPLGSSQFAVSGATLVYLPAGPGDDLESLVFVDRNGDERATGLSGRSFNQPRLAPDSHRIALTVTPSGSADANPGDLWLYDLDRHTFGRLTSDGATMPIWTPDGRGLTYTGRRSSPTEIITRAYDGSAPDEIILKGRPGANFPLSWSPDGTRLAFVGVSSGTTGNDLWMINMAAGGAVTPLVQTPYREGAPAFSPDGRFFAYVSDASGRNEVYLRPSQGTGQEVLVSSNGGAEPVWPRHGHELFFRQRDILFAVEVATTPSLRLGTPRPVLERTYKRSNAVWPNYDVAPDGTRLLMIKGSGRAAQPQFNVVLNWRPGP